MLTAAEKMSVHVFIHLFSHLVQHLLGGRYFKIIHVMWSVVVELYCCLVIVYRCVWWSDVQDAPIPAVRRRKQKSTSAGAWYNVFIHLSSHFLCNTENLHICVCWLGCSFDHKYGTLVQYTYCTVPAQWCLVALDTIIILPYILTYQCNGHFPDK